MNLEKFKWYSNTKCLSWTSVDFSDKFLVILHERNQNSEQKIFETTLNVEIFQWCENHCTGAWTRGTLDGDNTYYFAEPQDATSFSLKWL